MEFSSNVSISTESLCSALFSMQGFFFSFSLGFGLLAVYWKSFVGGGIGCFIKSLVPGFDLLIIGLLAMST